MKLLWEEEMNSEGPGFFDYEVRLSQLGDKDPLSKLDSLIEWEDFRPVLEKAVVQESKAPCTWQCGFVLKWQSENAVFNAYLKNND